MNLQQKNFGCWRILHVAFDEYTRFSSVHIHDDENAPVEAPKVDQIRNNKAIEKIEDKKKNQSNDVPRDSGYSMITQRIKF